MNALAIHLYLTITFINLVIIRLAQNYRIIVIYVTVLFILRFEGPVEVGCRCATVNKEIGARDESSLRTHK